MISNNCEKCGHLMVRHGYTMNRCLNCEHVQPREPDPVEPTPEVVRARVSALLMREALCEQVYRERERWSPDKPVKSLGLRSILPEEVERCLVGIEAEGVLLDILDTTADTNLMKWLGARVLDRILRDRAQLGLPEGEAPT